MKRKHLTTMTCEITGLERLDNRNRQLQNRDDPELLRVTLTPDRNDSLSQLSFSFVTTYFNGIGYQLSTSALGTKLRFDVSIAVPDYPPPEEESWHAYIAQGIQEVEDMGYEEMNKKYHYRVPSDA